MIWGWKGNNMIRDDWYPMNCEGCGKSGYSDEFTKKEGKLLCARCFYPHIDFDKMFHNA